jgi:hypothetical protein
MNMDDDSEVVDHIDGAPQVKRLKVYEEEAGPSAQPVNLPSVASKATGKPVLNTRALRSVLKGKN